MHTEVMRQAAQQRFQNLPRPAPKNEDYRFAPMAELSWEETPVEGSPGAEPPAALLALVEGEGAMAWLRSAGGKIRQTGAVAGVSVSSLRESKGLPAFAQDAHWDEDIFAQYALSRVQDGFVVRVEPGVKAALPLRLLYWLDAASKAFSFHTIVELGAGSELTLIEEYAGEGGNALALGVSDIRAGAGAKLRHVQLQDFGAETRFFLRQRTALAEGALVESFVLHVGGSGGQWRQDGLLQGEAAELRTVGTARGRDRQIFDLWCRADHQAPRAKSGLDFYCVMDDRARANFHGLIRIRKGCVDTDAYQKSRALLLSSQASAHAMPKLEIAVDAVKCAHGASVSTVNPEQLHYLQSRGIPEAEAQRMIVDGFLEPALVGLPESLAERVRTTLQARYAGKGKV